MLIRIVVPCYNEEAVLPDTAPRLLAVLDAVTAARPEMKGDILFVDDGSSDATWDIITALARQNGRCHGLKLAHNAGHQNALVAGLARSASQADAIVTIDADLQDDERVIPEMAARFLAGDDIVYGVRRERRTDTFFKRHSAQLFYRFMHAMGSDVLYNHADFRLMSRRAARALLRYPERNMFLRGMVWSIGLPHSTVSYDRHGRKAGESKYPLRKMLSFALDGITSFSVRPLRLIVVLGLVFIFISLLGIIYGLTSFARGHALPGWTSLIVSLWFIGGAILTAMGIIGEYVGKIYKEVKRRPRFIVEQEI